MAGYAHPVASSGILRRSPTAVTCSRPNQSGIALMLVLWVLALLTIIAVGLTAAQRTESTLAANQLAGARFRAAADAAINWAVLNLITPPTVFDDEVQVWVPDGAARTWTFAGETLEIRVSNEASRIELNAASQDLLVSLLQAVGLGLDQAAALADKIEDWRDANDLTELNGAEDDEYDAAGRTYGAKDGPFHSIGELQLVLGIERDLYRTLASALTADSDGAELDEEFAPPLVLAALQGITLEEALLQQEERQAQEATIGTVAPTLSRGGPIYRIRVTRLEDGQAGLTMEALVRAAAGESPPVSVLWRRFGRIAPWSHESPGEGGDGAADSD